MQSQCNAQTLNPFAYYIEQKDQARRSPARFSIQPEIRPYRALLRLCIAWLSGIVKAEKRGIA